MTVETITNESFEMQVYVHQKKLMNMHFIDIIFTVDRCPFYCSRKNAYIKPVAPNCQ